MIQARQACTSRRGDASSPHVFRGLRQQQTLALTFRMEAGSLCPGKNRVTNGVVPQGALAPCHAACGMMAEAVKHRLTFGTPSVFGRVWQSETEAELCHEACILHSCASGGRSCQESSGAQASFGPEDHSFRRGGPCYVGQVGAPC